jgi:purine-binding chemotaxis protein CheW
MTQASNTALTVTGDRAESGQAEFVTMSVDGQLFGIPVLLVQDALKSQKITRIPLASREVAGALNLRGRIVTAIDIRRRLGLPDRPSNEAGMNIVVEHGGELYSLIVDSVGEVLKVDADTFERNPATLDPQWKSFCKGIYRLDGNLLLSLDVANLLTFQTATAA